MPGGLTLLESLNADIPTPAAGKVTIFFSIDDSVPSYKNDAGVVNPLGTNGATGATGPMGPAIPMLFDTNEIEPMMIPGPQGASGAAGGSGRLIGIQIITTTGAGTYTPTAGTGSVIIEAVGGGGGGGGVATQTVVNVAIAQAAGGGGYFLKRLTTGFSGAGYVVGAKGAGGAAGNNAGGTGTATTFTETVGPTTFTAAGGVGGAGSAGGVIAPALRSSQVGGTATNGDINIAGGSGIPGYALSSTRMVPAMGGISKFGFPGNAGAQQANNISQAGSSAASPGKGAGGNGAISSETGAQQAGGDGSDGMIIIYEYSS